MNTVIDADAQHDGDDPHADHVQVEAQQAHAAQRPQFSQEQGHRREENVAGPAKVAP